METYCISNYSNKAPSVRRVSSFHSGDATFLINQLRLEICRYDEVDTLTAQQIRSLSQNFQARSSMLRRFTLMIWAEVTHIGCAAYGKTLKDGRKECMLTCNYGPAGNKMGRRMFTEGAPASACPEGLAANSKHTGLCGKARRNKLSLAAVGAAFLGIVLQGIVKIE